MQQSMPGTLTPDQMQQQQMMADILRQPQPQQDMSMAQPQQQIVSASPQGGMGNMLGNALGQAGDYAMQNFGTANQYGTNPFSQQTNMLAAQDAAFR